jgi:hypothetical protein
MVNFFERAPSERAEARELLTLKGRKAARPFDVVFDEAAELLRDGRDWLFENEQGRVPLG